MRLVGLVGLPGSGKTWWLSEAKASDSQSYFIDDIRSLTEIKEQAGKHETIYFASPTLCYDPQRKHACDVLKRLFPEATVSWLFWENNVESAWRNVVARNDGRRISRIYLEFLSKNYTPEGEGILPIYQGK